MDSFHKGMTIWGVVVAIALVLMICYIMAKETGSSRQKNIEENRTERVRLQQCPQIENEIGRVFCLTGVVPKEN